VYRTHGSADVPRAPVAPLLLALLIVLVLAACSGPDSVDGSVSASDSAPDEKPRTNVAVAEAEEATVGIAANAGESEGSSGGPFASRTEASGGSSYQADTLLAVRYGSHDGYERVVLDLGTGDRPAGKVPEWNLMSPEGEGVVRVTLPSVSRTDVSDGRLGDALLDGFYVVRAPEGGVFVDVFARKAFAYRVLELSDPARLVVDFEPTGEPLKSHPPAVGGDTVLVEPRAGDRVGDPLTVSGYSRNFEASNTIVLTDPEGETVVSRTVTGNDWSSTWGYFEATLDLRPFTGKGTLQVGTSSARDGSFRGVEVPVRGG
jgi:Immunoglobulin-like domain of bacterial spore germination